METEDNKEQVAVLKPHQDDDNDNNKKKQRFVIKTAIIAGSLLIIVIIVILLAVFLIKGRNKNKDNSKSDFYSSETYVLDEYTGTRYNHLLSYLNNEYHDLTFSDDISDIVSFSIKDGHLLVLTHNESQLVYFDATINGDILNIFKEEVPNVGAYPIVVQVETHNSSLVIDALDLFEDCSKFVLEITDYGSDHYVSFMGMKNEDEIVSLTHGEYITHGDYDYDIISKEDKALFDLYYYLLNEIE